VNTLSKRSKLLILLAAIAVLSFSITAYAESYTIKTSEDKFKGIYLVDQAGITLYYFQDDANAKGDSACVDDCSVQWPPFYASVITLSSDLNRAEFGEMTRKDGKKQTTFKGWPLYYYARDSAPGDFNGEGGSWHIIDPANQPQII
jgi:predicted lipoprotein with Yx(FWY)xxD motif